MNKKSIRGCTNTLCVDLLTHAHARRAEFLCCVARRNGAITTKGPGDLFLEIRLRRFSEFRDRLTAIVNQRITLVVGMRDLQRSMRHAWHFYLLHVVRSYSLARRSRDKQGLLFRHSCSQQMLS